MSRWGVWKILKRLQEEDIIFVKRTGKGKTSTQTLHLNWKNNLTEQTLALALAREATSQKRWRFNFADIEKKVDFLILYGSILHSPKTAGDIDILSVAKEKNLSTISKLIFTVQQTQEKKVHAHNFIAREFTQELQKPNKVFIDAVKKGVVLFGQQKFVAFMKRLFR